MSIVLLGLAAVALTGCARPTATPRTGLEAVQSISAPAPAQPFTSPQGRQQPPGQATPLFTGSTQAPAPLFQDSGDKVTLNLVNVAVAVACKAILSDILKKNFTLADNVTGAITLQTTRPVSKQSLIENFEAVLRTRGFVMTRQGDTYIVSASDATASIAPSFSDDPSLGVGRQARIVPLSHVSAKEMAEIVKSVAPQGVLRADNDRNALLLTGTTAELNAMLQAVSMFDVDWMRNKSSALYRLESGVDPAVLVKQIDKMFATGSGAIAEGAIRFIPSRELGGILVIAARRDLLERAGGVIQRMDAAAGEQRSQTFIYKVENRTAKELAAIVRGAVSGRSAPSTGLADPSSATTTTVPAAPSTQDQPAAAVATPDMAALSGSGISVVADEANNSLVIGASRPQYERMLPMLTALDRMPGQVLIEAVIAEATLSDQLKFGLKYSIGAGNFLRFTNANDGTLSNAAAGFTYSATTPDFRVVLNALSQITDVKVVSSPTLTVLDNKTARLQIGDQVPIISASQTSPTTQTTTTQVEMKDTGVILKVTPRISSNGHVLLDVEQEVSDVVNTTTSGIDSPTIRQRRVASTILVGDGQSIVIGGLVQEKRQKATSAVPVLGKLPVIGNAFRQRDDLAARTELMIFIRTRVMRDQTRAQAISNEFREGLDAVSIKRPRTRAINDWDMLRLVD